MSRTERQPQRAGTPNSAGPRRAGARDTLAGGLGGAERGRHVAERGTGPPRAEHTEKGSAEVGTGCPPSPAGTLLSPFPPQKCSHVFPAQREQWLPLSVLSRGPELPPRLWETPMETPFLPKVKHGLACPARAARAGRAVQGKRATAPAGGMREGAGRLQAQHLLSSCSCGSSNSIAPSPPGPKPAQYEEQHACVHPDEQ